MTEESDLIAAIVANPKENTPRLMYADWLRERNGPGDVDRATLIQSQINQGEFLACVTPKYGEIYSQYLRSAPVDRVYIGCATPGLCEGCRHNEDLGSSGRWNIRYFAGAFLQRLPGGPQGSGQLVRYPQVVGGFIETLVGPTEVFLKWCDELLWHPKQTSTCQNCDGRGEERFCDAAGDMDDTPCLVCGFSGGWYKRGSGTVSRSCPVTAQPIKHVALTTSIGQLTREWFESRWPDVIFDLDEEPSFDDPFPDVPWGGGL